MSPRALQAQLRIELLLALRRGESILITLVVPLALLVFFGGLAPLTVEGSLMDFLVPGILSLGVMSTSMVSLGISTAFERYYGVLKRLLGSPLRPSTLLVAKSLAVLAIEVLQVLLVLGVARFAFDWTPRGSLVLGGLVLLLGSIAFAGIGLLMAGTLRADATLAAANGLYLLFLLLGGFVLPTEHLPPVVGFVARLLPGAALSEATRAALATGSDLLGPLSLLGGWSVVSVTAAVRLFRVD